MIALLFAAAVASGTIHDPNWTYYGSGDKSCAAWVSDASTSSVGGLAQSAWFSGFVSGVNRATGGDMMASSDMKGAQAWITNYCNANPLQKLTYAVEALVVELAKAP